MGSHCDKPLTYDSHPDVLPASNLVFDIADRRHSTPIKTIEEKKVHQFELQSKIPPISNRLVRGELGLLLFSFAF